MTFLGDVPVGSSVQVTMADRDQILNGAYLSVMAARESFPKSTLPQAALVFSCSGRKVLLGTRVSEEYEIIRRELGNEISIAGFYAYGEFGPAMNGVHGYEFHNQTFVTILFGTDR